MYLELANRVVDTFDLGQLEGPVLHFAEESEIKQKHCVRVVGLRPENHLLAYSCLSISCQGERPNKIFF